MLSERPTIAVKCVDAKQSFADSPVHVVTALQPLRVLKNVEQPVMWPALVFICAVAYSLAPPPWQRRQKSYYTKKFFVVDPGFQKQ